MDSERQTPSFTAPRSEPSSTSLVPWIVAGAVILAIVAVLLLTSHRKAQPANALLPLAPDASSLVFSDIEMSESSSLSGGKVTYIDGHVRNAGTRPVSGATLQVVFSNDVQMSPQLETVPLYVIRTHEPYIDTEPLTAAPLAPGAEREFRLPFENISDNWNQQLPEIRVIHVDLQ